VDLTLKKLVGRLNGVCYGALEAAAGACVNRGGEEITVEDVLVQLLEGVETDLSLLLASRGIEVADFKAGLQRELERSTPAYAGRPVFSSALVRWLEQAWLYASVELGESRVRSAALTVALRANRHWYGMTEYAECIDALPAEVSGSSDQQLLARSAEACTGDEESGSTRRPTDDATMVERFTEDFTERAHREEIDPVFGRDREVRQALDILCRRQKNNPILVGEAGVGKTAVVEGLALRIAAGDVPPNLADAHVMALDVGALQAGAGVRGEFEKRLNGLIGEIRSQTGPVILFVDEAHTLIGAGGDAGGGDAANLLKPALARGDVKVVAATTWAEYRRYFEKDAALARRFQPVHIDEPSIAETVTILRGLQRRYEEAHDVYIRDDALGATASMAARYITGRRLPDKAVDVLDTACARVQTALSSRPAPLQAMEAEKGDLERERDALARDLQHGVTTDRSRLESIANQLADLSERRDALTAAWSSEREAVDALINARRGAGAPAANDFGGRWDAGEAAPSYAEPSEEVAARRSQLDQCVGAYPLIPHEVSPDVISRVIADWTGVPVGRLIRDESRVLLRLEEYIGERVRGQGYALHRIAEQLRASKSGLTAPEAPLGVFLLAGPSGIGKTETATAVAEILFGGAHALTTINMSEFQERQSVSRLIGSPPGYVGYGEGGVLTEAVRQRPYCVVLFDEIEKANPEVLSLFYQLLDKGVVNDGEGRRIDFQNTAVFMTSNLATDAIREAVTQAPRIDQATLAEAAAASIRAHIPTALLARMTLVPFRPIPRHVLGDIVERKLDRVAERLREKYSLELDFDQKVLTYILDRSNTEDEGARNLEAIINGDVVPAMAQSLLEQGDQIEQASRCRIEVTGNKVTAKLVGAA